MELKDFILKYKDVIAIYIDNHITKIKFKKERFNPRNNNLDDINNKIEKQKELLSIFNKLNNIDYHWNDDVTLEIKTNSFFTIVKDA